MELCDRNWLIRVTKGDGITYSLACFWSSDPHKVPHEDRRVAKTHGIALGTQNRGSKSRVHRVKGRTDKKRYSTVCPDDT